MAGLLTLHGTSHPLFVPHPVPLQQGEYLSSENMPGPGINHQFTFLNDNMGHPLLSLFPVQASRLRDPIYSGIPLQGLRVTAPTPTQPWNLCLKGQDVGGHRARQQAGLEPPCRDMSSSSCPPHPQQEPQAQRGLLPGPCPHPQGTGYGSKRPAGGHPGSILVLLLSGLTTLSLNFLICKMGLGRG